MLEHGGNLRDALVRYGRPAADWLDLSTGINPHFYTVSPDFLQPNAWHRLPEKSFVLSQAAQDFYGAPTMLAVAGTQAAIQTLPCLRPTSKVVVSAPSYAEHAYQWRQHQHQVREVAYDALASAIPDADVVVVCNPNNPTGAFIEPDVLLNWAAQLARRDGWLIVDEAFADTMTELSVAAYTNRPGLIVLRSVGKFFGLAGLRLGFVAAQAELLERLEIHLGPWTISGPAQQIATKALRDTDWQQTMCVELAGQGERLRQLLLVHGLRSSGTDLFQWCSEQGLHCDAELFWQHMAEQGIWLRLFRQAARGVRFGLPPDEPGWQKLTQALTLWRVRQSILAAA
ncbi:threonine-phosphate decarboxylase CobD [Undibacterium sp. RuTC16W]|uniref:threonine-phosphate decarboxylase CobD n=1 Tax=Undibacterium sp. RuTC16W TaxID=3413048 RepID=UPI003BF14D19